MLTCALNSTRSWTDTPRLITLFRNKAIKTGKIAEELAKLMRIYDIQSADGPDLTETPLALLTVVTDDTTDLARFSPESIFIVFEDEILVNGPTNLADSFLLLFEYIYALEYNTQRNLSLHSHLSRTL
ncbi:unnamed protein product [Oreochromis niloticus]|nr:unnamed protein product [Mustela putorius furo]